MTEKYLFDGNLNSTASTPEGLIPLAGYRGLDGKMPFGFYTPTCYACKKEMMNYNSLCDPCFRKSCVHDRTTLVLAENNE